VGTPSLVMQRGNIIVEGEEFKGKKGQGNFLPVEILKK